MASSFISSVAISSDPLFPRTPLRANSSANSRNRPAVCSGVRGDVPVRRSGWPRLRFHAPSTSGASGQNIPGHPTATHSCNRIRFSAATARETRRAASSLRSSRVSRSSPRDPSCGQAWIRARDDSSSSAARAATRSLMPASPGEACPVQPSASQRYEPCSPRLPAAAPIRAITTAETHPAAKSSLPGSASSRTRRGDSQVARGEDGPPAVNRPRISSGLAS
ncbi:MAG: hypothetical protein ACO3E8_04675 [Candidatus Methylacidiphilales bacterium]